MYSQPYPNLPARHFYMEGFNDAMNNRRMQTAGQVGGLFALTIYLEGWRQMHNATNVYDTGNTFIRKCPTGAYTYVTFDPHGNPIGFHYDLERAKQTAHKWNHDYKNR